MKTEQQNEIWVLLPRWFKEKVKKTYRYYSRMPRKDQYDLGVRDTFEIIFGIHNLTSDAEGEEMLMCAKSRIQQQYKRASQLKDDSDPKWEFVGDQIERVLIGLFGSKCLPNEEQPKQKDCDNPLADKEGCKWRNNGKCAFGSACYFEPLNPQEPKPAEPKFKVGDKVKDISSPHDDGIYKVDDIKKSSDGFIYHIQGLIGKSNVKESNLEPYTEPTAKNPKENANTFAFGNPINTKSDDFDCILKDSFRDERRLNVAVQMIKAMMGCPEIIERISSAEADSLLDDILHDALHLTDRLMSECEKGGGK